MLVASGCSAQPQPAPTSTIPLSVVGKWAETPDSAGQTITFKDGGEFVGNDGCNSKMGTYRVSDGRVDLEFTGGTEAACSKDVWLDRSTSASLQDDQLTFADGSGGKLGEMTRSGN